MRAGLDPEAFLPRLGRGRWLALGLALFIGGSLAASGLRAPTPTFAATTRLVDNVIGNDTNNLCTSSPCKTIQHAVDLSSAGDTIQLAAETFAEHVTIGHGGLTITGVGSGSTAVDGSNSGTVFTITAGPVKLSGLTVQHGSATNGNGGGIYDTSGDLTLDFVQIINNNAATFGDGGGIYYAGGLCSNLPTIALAADIIIIPVTRPCQLTTTTFVAISGNSANSGSGGGIFNEGSATLTDGYINNNSAQTGGAVVSRSASAGVSASLTLTNVDINGNTSHGFGAVNSNSGALTLTSVSIENNTGGAVTNEGTATLTNVTVNNNSDALVGGIFNGGALTMANSTISGNSGQGGSSGSAGGFSNFGGTVTLINVTISGNSLPGG